MNIGHALPTQITDVKQIPVGEIYRLVYLIASRDLEPVNPAENLMKLLMLILAADSQEAMLRECVIEVILLQAFLHTEGGSKSLDELLTELVSELFPVTGARTGETFEPSEKSDG